MSWMLLQGKNKAFLKGKPINEIKTLGSSYFDKAPLSSGGGGGGFAVFRRNYSDAS